MPLAGRECEGRENIFITLCPNIRIPMPVSKAIMLKEEGKHHLNSKSIMLKEEGQHAPKLQINSLQIEKVSQNFYFFFMTDLARLRASLKTP